MEAAGPVWGPERGARGLGATIAEQFPVCFKDSGWPEQGGGGWTSGGDFAHCMEALKVPRGMGLSKATFLDPAPAK